MFHSDPEDFKRRPDSVTGACPATGIAADFDPFSHDYMLDPHPFYIRARAEEPIFYDPKTNYWVVTRFADIQDIFRDPETFSPALTRHPVTPLCAAAAKVRDSFDIAIERSLVDEDLDTHRQHRRVFGEAFTPKRVNELEPKIREIVTRYIDRFAKAGHAELVSQMLFEIPALVIFIFLGAPDEDAVLVKQLGATRAVVNWGRPTNEQQIEMMSDMGRHWEFTKRLVDAALENPGDNYLGDMARHYHRDPSLFSVNYLYNVVFQMQFAGHETTTQASANGIKALLENRDQWQALVDDPTLCADAVDEILRYGPSIFTWRRLVTRDTKIGDKEIPAGSRILMLLGSGNRDEEVFPDGERFDVRRDNAKRHFSFGLGAHFCMGAPLARLEIRIFLEELTRRFPDLRLKEGQSWTYVPTLAFRGVQELQVEWDAS